MKNKILTLFKKDENAFTGLEAAIVLTAFVVVAAVFSYVVLGAGFFTSDTAKETIHTGVKQATSSVELCGDVVAKGTSGANVTQILVTLQLTAGGTPVDIGLNSSANKMVISYQDSALYTANTTWQSSFIGNSDTDALLEEFEKVELTIDVPTGSNINSSDASNKEFNLQIKPSVGATLPITRTIPPQVDAVMLLN
ncbi:archaellin/type IV pilin N-terminal domain-containing protein [Methanosarcina sp. 1.H.A.2.2]|uniref:archaellin/type IV pilin N-terminal domain-containing protein n=1 Tax=Methanosarcina sp. 1.H.A.2.2 TaxID=1483601 RepID=UPI000B1D7356|nr:archaellin/type IV pilin N-terminal domain-containing protein [Methanosarcina sp. 1.H.A.2.2]